MTNEPPSGLTANMSRSCISSRALLEELTDQAAEPEAANRLFFGLCMFHAIVEGRRDYGALGWNVHYEFPISDLQITTRQLCHYASSSPTLEGAIAAVLRLAGDCNYGGRIADEHDRRVLSALLSHFCDSSILKEDFKVQGLSDYSLPVGALDHSAHLAHIRSLPYSEPPELFGLHANAGTSKNMKGMRSLCSQLLRMGEIEGLDSQGDSASRSLDAYDSDELLAQDGDEARVEALCEEVLSRLPASSFDLHLVRQQYPITRNRSINSVLAQELHRFNTLLELIKHTLTDLKLTMRGE